MTTTSLVIPAKAGIHASRERRVPGGHRASRPRKERSWGRGAKLPLPDVGCADFPATTSRRKGRAGRMGSRLMAIVAEGDRSAAGVSARRLRNRRNAHGRRSRSGDPEGDVPTRLTGGTCVPYGLTTWGRPLHSSATGRTDHLLRFGAGSNRAHQARRPGNDLPFRDGGTGATAYAEAIGVYSGLALSRFADRNNAPLYMGYRPHGHASLYRWIGAHGQSSEPFRPGRRSPWRGTMEKPIHSAIPAVVTAALWAGSNQRFDSLMGLTPGAAEADSAPSQNHQPREGHLHRPALLRQHRLPPILSDFLLRLAAPLATIDLSRTLLHTRRPEGRRTGRHPLPTREQQTKPRPSFSMV